MREILANLARFYGYCVFFLMKTVLVQQNISWADPEGNRKHIDELLSGVEDADLVVLPEMFSTGFATDPAGIAENSPSGTLEWMKSKAADLDAAIAGSVATCEDGKYFNRFHFVMPDGETVSYDKHHLFTYGGEHLTFTPGTDRCIVEWCGVRFLLIVCYDLRFPVWIRNRSDYDAIICVASWPETRRDAWDTLVRARAIENQCYFLAVNRCGTDPKCVYSGGTAFVDPCGRVLASAPDYEEAVIEGELDMEELEEFRAKFPVLTDSDNFTL